MIKYHPANHKIQVYSNEIKKFDMWTLPWQALWQLPLHIITAQAVAVGCVWCSWWQFSTFHCRIASLWIICLRGYRDMDRIDIGIEMWYQYRYRYRKICNDMQPYTRYFIFKLNCINWHEIMNHQSVTLRPLQNDHPFILQMAYIYTFYGEKSFEFGFKFEWSFFS